MWVCIKYYIPKEYSYVDPLLGNSLRSLVFSLGELYFLLVVNEVGCKMVNYILRCETNHLTLSLPPLCLCNLCLCNLLAFGLMFCLIGSRLCSRIG